MGFHGSFGGLQGFVFFGWPGVHPPVHKVILDMGTPRGGVAVVVAVGPLGEAAMSVTHGGFLSTKGFKIERSPCPDGDSSDAFWRSDDVSCLESMHLFFPWKVNPWEAEFVGFCPAIRSTSCGLDMERNDVRALGARCHRADHGGVEGMGFREPEPCPIPFGLGPRGLGDWEAVVFKPFHELWTKDVHGGRGSQRFFQLGLEGSQLCGILPKELGDGLVSLGLVAGDAGEGQVADPVRAACGSWDDVILGQGQVPFPTVVKPRFSAPDIGCSPSPPKVSSLSHFFDDDLFAVGEDE